MGALDILGAIASVVQLIVLVYCVEKRWSELPADQRLTDSVHSQCILIIQEIDWRRATLSPDNVLASEAFRASLASIKSEIEKRRTQSAFKRWFTLLRLFGQSDKDALYVAAQEYLSRTGISGDAAVERIYNRVSPNGIAEDVKGLLLPITTTLTSIHQTSSEARDRVESLEGGIKESLRLMGNVLSQALEEAKSEILNIRPSPIYPPATTPAILSDSVTTSGMDIFGAVRAALRLGILCSSVQNRIREIRDDKKLTKVINSDCSLLLSEMQNLLLMAGPDTRRAAEQLSTVLIALKSRIERRNQKTSAPNDLTIVRLYGQEDKNELLGALEVYQIQACAYANSVLEHITQILVPIAQEVEKLQGQVISQGDSESQNSRVEKEIIPRGGNIQRRRIVGDASAIGVSF